MVLEVVLSELLKCDCILILGPPIVTGNASKSLWDPVTKSEKNFHLGKA